MTQILISSSLLIAVVLLARWLLRERVGKRLIYGAWLLVALRLLIPVQFGHSQYSVAAMTEQLEQRSEPIQQVQQSLQEPIAGPSRAEVYEQLLQDYIQGTPAPSAPAASAPQTPQTIRPVTPAVQEKLQQEAQAQISAPTFGQVLTAIWIGGMVIMAGWFLITNALFLHRARKNAEPFACDAPVRVRISVNIPSPCLVGLFRPVIYLTPGSVQNEQTMKHVLTHEISHLRHGDHIWSWVRCICLCVYWFNPLVWTAAILSKRDCELACDESALKKLGSSERTAYGQTLLVTVSQARSPAHILETATAMNETKKQLKERVNFIVKKPKNLFICTFCLILVASLAAGCAFLGSKPETKPEPTPPNTPIAPSKLNEESLRLLFQQAEKIVNDNKVITLGNYWPCTEYAKYSALSYAITAADGVLTLDTSLIHDPVQKYDNLVYITFLDLVMDQFGNGAAVWDIHYNELYNRNYDSAIFLSTQYQAAGYANGTDYRLAIDEGKCEMPDDAFIISCMTQSIHRPNGKFKELFDTICTPSQSTPTTPSTSKGYRHVYNQIWTEFFELIDETQAQDWRDFVLRGTPDNEMLLVTFVKRYSIPREAFDQAARKFIAKSVLWDWDIRDEEIEVPNADVIYTFDNDIINEYYRKDAPVYNPLPAFTVLDGDYVPDAPVLPTYQPGSIQLSDPIMDEYNFDRTFRIAYYRHWTVFLSLLDKEQQAEYDKWLDAFQKQNGYGTQTEMLTVAFIKHFNIPREEFEQAVAYYQAAVQQFGYELTDETFEAPNVDILYTFDNEIINEYYRLKTDQLLETSALAKEHLNMSYAEFLYASNHVITQYMLNRDLTEVIENDAKEHILWDALAIRGRRLYIDTLGRLMIHFEYSSGGSESALGHQDTEFDLEKYGWVRPADLKAESYTWLFDMVQHSDGYLADSYYSLLADVMFTDPDAFISHLSLRSQEEIRSLGASFVYTSYGLEELDTIKALLTYMQANAPAADQQTLDLLVQSILQTEASLAG